MKTIVSLALALSLPAACLQAQGPHLALLGVMAAGGSDSGEECEGDPGGADFWAKAAGKVGVGLFADAVLVMRIRNHDRPGVPLGEREREALRPLFGDLVDHIQVVWNARLLDEWRALGRTFQFGIDAAGQTFGNTVYLSESPPAGDLSERRLKLIIHEMVHSRQAREMGGLKSFGDRYIRGWWQAGRDYGSNWMEVQARCVADREHEETWARYQRANQESLAVRPTGR